MIVNRLRYTKSECLDHPLEKNKVAVVERWLPNPTKKEVKTIQHLRTIIHYKVVTLLALVANQLRDKWEVVMLNRGWSFKRGSCNLSIF